MPQIEVQDNNHRDDTSHHNNKSTNNLSNNFSNNNSNTFNSNFEIRNECHAGENFSTYDCHMETARNMDIIMNTNLNVNFNHNYENNNISLKNKSLSSEINYFENNDNNTRNSFYFNNIDNNRINTPSNNFSTTTNPLNFYTPNTQNGKLEYELLSRMHSKSMSLKQNHSLLKSKNSLLMLDRKSSNFSNGDSNLMMNKPNINNLPFILRSNSFRNNENVNLLKVSQNSHMGTMNFQTPNATPHRSKKDEIKKWLSRI